MRAKKIAHNQRGVAAVELAIILPLLLIVLFAIIEFTFLLYDNAMVTNASREGARAGVVFRPDHNTLTTEEITDVVKDFAEAHLISFGESNLTVTATHTDSADGIERDVTEALTDDDGESIISSGEPLEVSVEYPYEFLILPSFVASWVSGTEVWENIFTLRAVTVMRYE